MIRSIPDISASAGTHARVLLVLDDNDELHDTLLRHVDPQRMELVREDDESRIRHAIDTGRVDLVLADASVPRLDSVRFLRWLRAIDDELPIVIVTPAGATDLRASCLDSGADDCVGAEMEAEEILARLRRRLRPRPPTTGTDPRSGEPIVFGNCRLVPATRQAWQGERRIDLSETEFALLWALASRRGHTVSRGRLLREVRGHFRDPYSRSIDVLVARLRRKLGETPGRPDHIRTIRGVGYALVSADPDGED